MTEYLCFNRHQLQALLKHSEYEILTSVLMAVKSWLPETALSAYLIFKLSLFVVLLISHVKHNNAQ